MSNNKKDTKKTKYKRSSNLTENGIEKALKATGGLVYQAAQILKVPRKTLYKRFERKPEKWRPLLESIREKTTDEIENVLIKKAKDGCTPELLFYMKCQGKKRGYVEDPKFKIDIGKLTDTWNKPRITKDMTAVEAEQKYKEFMQRMKEED